MICFLGNYNLTNVSLRKLSILICIFQMRRAVFFSRLERSYCRTFGVMWSCSIGL